MLERSIRVRRAAVSIPLMQSVLRATLQPAMLLWHLSTQNATLRLPRPMDVSRGYVAGPSPDRVLLLGGDLAAGCGVLTHQLGIVGHLARQLSCITGRGIELEARADVGMTLRRLASRVRDIPALGSGAVVVMVGVNDALRLTSLRAWQRDLLMVLDIVHAGASGDVQILVVGIPPLGNAPVLAKLRRAIADRHARRLNESSKRLCRERPRVTFVPFPSVDASVGCAEPKPPLGGSVLTGGNSSTYQKLSRYLAVPLAGALYRVGNITR